ncbi:MAG: urease accessory protein UreE [Alistipes sp.]|nr:urease accessory protein UreE [Alistipes sp.]
MKIYTRIIGNLSSPEWKERIADCDVEYMELDQWTAQKSRFVAVGDRNNKYAVALERRSQLSDGDIIEYDPQQRRIAAVRIRLNEVMVIDLGGLAKQNPETVIHIAVELGHAIGNQHWPAVVKGTAVYVPLTVDRKVMDSVMRTHHIENISYEFRPGDQIIPYLAPHEIRRLFGATGPDSHTHDHYRHHSHDGHHHGHREHHEHCECHEHEPHLH